MARLIVIFAIVIVVVLAARRFFGSEIFKIEVRSRGVEIKGSVPGYADSDVIQFIEELGLSRGAVIKGVPGGERYRLEFNGAVPESDRQRVRNYFYLKF